MADLFQPKPSQQARQVASYPYHDEGGVLLFEVIRFEPKSFRQRRADGAWSIKGVRRVLYRLPELHEQPLVFVVEGEKDADRLWSVGLAATTSPGGAGKWRDEYAGLLVAAGVRQVIVLPDNDTAGREHATAVARSCRAKGIDVSVVDLPGLQPKGDVSDWLDAGGTPEALLDLANRPKQPGATSVGDLATLLDAVAGFIRRFVVVSGPQATTLALWVAHTHAFEAADATPYLAITSATKRAGKTRLLEVLEPLASRPWLTGRTSTAALVRKIDSEKPTLLLDESDAAFKGDTEYSETLRGVLNSGYRRSGKATVCVGQGAALQARDFSTFCPKAIAGIGVLPDTVMDRSIRIELRRRTEDEPCERWRERDGHRDAEPLRERLASLGSVVEALRAARPALPPRLGDRQHDVWEPLLAIADLAGEEYGERARASAMALSAAIEDSDLGVELLRDIRTVLPGFTAQSGVIPTKDLIEGLSALDDRPWASFNRGQPITPHRLRNLLRAFGIGPTRLEHCRGYRTDAFDEAMARYLPFETSERQDRP